MKRIASILLFSFGFSVIAGARLEDLAPIQSPNGRYLASVKLVPSKDLGKEVEDSTLPNAKVAVVCLKDAHKEKDLHSIVVPDAEDTDHRNSVSLSWSPDGRILEIQVQIGQLSGFSLYRIVSDKLVEIEQLPIPKKLVIEPEQPKSRGGAYIKRWTGNDTFVAMDTIAGAEYTYRITKEWKAEAIASKPKKEEAEHVVGGNGG